MCGVTLWRSTAIDEQLSAWEAGLKPIDRDFHGRVVLLGYGTIGQALLPLLLSELALPARRVTVIDANEGADAAGYLRYKGMASHRRRLDEHNVHATLATLLRPGDLLINASVGVDSVAVALWCHRHDVLYIDSSLEPWGEQIWNDERPPHKLTEYAHHQHARMQPWQSDGPTVVVCHGANPGLVSHFVKAALLELAEALELEAPVPAARAQWAALAEATGTRVIHISERDTQMARLPKRPDEFVNTWSILGFVEEARMPVEIGWGTHEQRLPPGACMHERGPRNSIYLPRVAGRVLLRSWVPDGQQIYGLALPHSEAITISDYLTRGENGSASYRPTVAFAYLPCDAAMASLHETMMRDWKLPERQRVLTDELVGGMDELGVLLLGHELGGWWFGSQLDVAEARRLVPGSNPTAVQVAAGMLAAALWAIANPRRGYCEPEQLPHDAVLEVARPYLGRLVSRGTSWTPLRRRRSPFAESWLDRDDPWQFANFLVRV
jgi:homospermidine synthase